MLGTRHTTSPDMKTGFCGSITEYRARSHVRDAHGNGSGSAVLKIRAGEKARLSPAPCGAGILRETSPALRRRAARTMRPLSMARVEPKGGTAR